MAAIRRRFISFTEYYFNVHISLYEDVVTLAIFFIFDVEGISHTAGVTYNVLIPQVMLY